MAEAQKKQWAVCRPLNPGCDQPEFELCRCDSVDAVLAVVAALMRAGVHAPAVVVVREVNAT